MRQLKQLSLLLGLLLLGPSAYAQSVRFQSQAISTRGAGIANATVAVCLQPANTNTQPCSPLATLATSTITTSGGANPLTADSFGNFFFYAAPGRYTVQIYGPAVSGQFVTPDVEVTSTAGGSSGAFSTLTVSGTGTFTGALVPKNLDNVQVVDSTLSRGGTDIGNEINLAYAALPSTGGTIYLYPKSDGTCYSYSTAISFTTAGKYVRLASGGVTATGSGNGTQGGACLNFTVTASQTPAILFDIPPSGQTQGAVYGLEYIHLINNGCLTTGGCGSNAFGVSCGSTNLGCTGAHFDGVSINGFLRAFDNRNANSSNYTWTNAQIVANQTIARLGNNTGNMFFGGTMAGNGSGFVADAAGSAFSLDLFGVQFFGNGGVTFDCTNVVGGSPCIVNGYDLHLEASPGGTPHFAQGNFDLNLHGGVAEDDVTSGSTDWMFNCSGGDVIVDGTVFAGGGRSITNLVLLNSPCRAMVRGEIKGSYVGKVTGGICGGANAAFCTTLMLNGPSTNAALPFAFESPLTLNGVGTANPGNTVALTADWTCGTGGTVASCTSATIIGSGGGVPLTFALPLVAQSYTLECDGVVGQATAVTANQWNLLTATNGATNVTANYSMATAATASAYGAVTDQASTTTTFQIAPSWTLGGTATKMPFHIWAKIQGASASGTVVSLQLLAPTVGDLVTIYQGTSCRVF